MNDPSFWERHAFKLLAVALLIFVVTISVRLAYCM
jgi:hypothetical protein